ncbi:hypothetical protein PJP84_004802 [Salmonella enterica]|nr:hypothetical protein [Salmonella enterica]EKJ5807318.1 hypothetical protein [Salmonella enterica]
MTIDQDRCRSATHSLQQSHVDNIPSPFPPRQTPVAARYGKAVERREHYGTRSELDTMEERP